MADLWTLYLQDKNSTLPILSRKTGDVRVNSTNPGQGIFNITKIYNDTSTGNVSDFINVVNDFHWTTSPRSSTLSVPFAYLVEKRIIINSNVSNIVNSIYTSFDSINNATTLTKYIQNLVQNNKDNPLVKTIGDVTNKLVNNAQSVFSSPTFQQSTRFSDPVMSPYDFLYATEYTGFNYKVPYFDDDYNTGSLTFGNDNNNVFSSIVDIAENVSGGLTGILGSLKPGTYIERSKQFAMSDAGRSVQIKFPLLNTRSTNDISKNFQLIFGLIYQNRPGRLTRSIIDLPVIYQVHIPGVVYMPYAYIQNLSVKFLGTRRLMYVDVPAKDANGDNIPQVRMTVPDAYEVSITLQGLNEESRNFMYRSLSNSSSPQIIVGSTLSTPDLGTGPNPFGNPAFKANPNVQEAYSNQANTTSSTQAPLSQSPITAILRTNANKILGTGP